MIALTHQPSSSMQACERTFVPFLLIDFELAQKQHSGYCQALAHSGASVRTLDVNTALPDCTFIEDTAIVLDEVAILCSMGTPSRQAEPAALEAVLREYRPLELIEPSATLEGGDLLRIGRRLLVGQSRRTNAAGFAALEAITGRFGYRVSLVPVLGCLHLKTACTALPDGRLLVNPAWFDVRALAEFDIVQVPQDEPWGANICLVGSTVLLPAANKQTADLISRLGFSVRPVDISEFAKAEGGVTCLSLIFNS